MSWKISKKEHDVIDAPFKTMIFNSIESSTVIRMLWYKFCNRMLISNFFPLLNYGLSGSNRALSLHSIFYELKLLLIIKTRHAPRHRKVVKGRQRIKVLTLITKWKKFDPCFSYFFKRSFWQKVVLWNLFFSHLYHASCTYVQS